MSLAQLLEHFFIELQPFFIWLFLDPVRENPRPGNRHAEGLKAHFLKQRDVFFIMMVEINAVTLRIINFVFRLQRRFNIGRRRMPLGNIVFFVDFRLKPGDIGNRNSFPVNVPRAFALVSGDSAAP